MVIVDLNAITRGNRYVQAAPRATWDDCVRAEIRAASQHPGVQVFVISSREGDSTESNVAAHTLRRVPDVVVGGKQMNADLIRSIGARSGRTLDSAIIVISLQEEYALLRARGLERTTAATLQCGRSLCDQMEVIDRKRRMTRMLYFDISIPQAWGAKHLRQE